MAYYVLFAHSSLPLLLTRCPPNRARQPVTLCIEPPPAAASTPVTKAPSPVSHPPPADNNSIQSLPSYNLVHVPRLTDYITGLPHHDSLLLNSRASNTFTNDQEVVLENVSFDAADPTLLTRPFRAFQKAGPRKQSYYARGVRAVIVSCGGICPGINSVIRELTLCLFQYSASKVFGIRHGYRGFYDGHWTELTPDLVESVHKVGGSMLGSSRGGFDLIRIVDAIETRNIDHVYVIGGDGTIMGCTKIYHEIRRRGLKIAVVSVPKTIDNDIAIIDRSFGFETAVDEAQRAINAAYVEAHSFPDCVGIVKLMGRNSGFIAAWAALASREVDCCLVPEELFVLRGKGGVLEYVESVVDRKGSCVLVVAEGAGHEMYGQIDIGRHILAEVKDYFAGKDREITTKYLDPTYQIRAIPTTTHDNILCILMAHAAVHGAYAGYTGYSAGPVNGVNVMLPLDMLAGIQKKMETSDGMWQRLRMSTGQPDWNLPEEFTIGL